MSLHRFRWVRLFSSYSNYNNRFREWGQHRPRRLLQSLVDRIRGLVVDMDEMGQVDGDHLVLVGGIAGVDSIAERIVGQLVPNVALVVAM